ncbi:flagellar hook-associated protein FlgK [Pseudoprimorskyibacter insulae]|uniref:Flagellar hook-associated protein 1 n=1 Tax=Pseudoprimorskyibacter insulae TaxID=1695997 RepID=A0A2R8ATQ6_9RHOB|nr:flagellar hook-associated protein FlgK [Pseudoprimorskyibacter insulae]SPF79426.1 Flagellar hook-associated protein 1 [Pseudoprimorskyibacter insulae]
MTLSGAINNAVGGLTANTRSAAIVSSNIANALTESYARRELVVSSDATSTHGGVRVNGVLRHVDPVIQAQRRIADGQSGQAGDLQTFHTEMERIFGQITDETSLSGRLTQFETSLITAAADPSSNQRLTNVAQAATALSDKLNAVAKRVQDVRSEAEFTIANLTDQLNDNLKVVEDLNKRVSAALHTGQDASALLDQRQQAVDRISELVPIRLLPRDRDTVAIVTTGGAILLDGNAAEFSFTRANEITAQMTAKDGALSPLSMNGRPVNMGGSGPFAGGRLAAQFEIRDQLAPATQTRLDALALDLAAAFGPGGVDTTVPPGQAGLFTDLGSEAVAANETGLAERLRLNVAVAPNEGQPWRLRAGLFAASPGAAGDGALLTAMRDRLNTATSPASENLPQISQTLFVRFAEAMTEVADARVDSDRSLASINAQRTALKELEFAGGVDSDAELERLMMIEQNYAANAQVISVANDLIQRLLSI